MSTKYSESDIREKVVNELRSNASGIYDSKVVKYTGNTYDTKRSYSEIVSDELIKNFHTLSSIGSGVNIRSTKPFRLANHNGKSNVSHRAIRDGEISYSEKGLAIAMFNDEDKHCIGKFVDYEVPLNEKRNDGFGKIDLLTYKNKEIRLVELKIHGKRKNTQGETLIRALLEIYTYYKLISGSGSTSKFISEYAQNGHAVKSIQIAILTDKISRSGETMLDIANNPCLLALIKKIGKDVGQPVEGYVFTYPSRGKPFYSVGKEMSKAKIYLDGKVFIEQIV